MKSMYHYTILLALVLGCAGLVGALASGLGARAGLWEFRAGFTILRWSAYTAGASAILALLCLAAEKLSGGPLEPRAVAALLLGLVVFTVPWFTVREFRKIPTVADATTNIEDPPSFIALVPVRVQSAQNPLAYRREEAAPLQTQYFPDLETMETRMTPAEVITLARQMAEEDMGLEIVAAQPGEGRLEATATTFWFGFKDDLVLRARAQPDGATLIDIRSASRVGRLDGGVNGKRVRRLMQELRKSL